MSKFRNFEKYEVFEDGRIWSYWTNKWLKPITKKNGYQVVWLSDNEGNRKSYLLHRVVYETFSGEQIPENLEINHIDERKDNNGRSNLELVSHKQNINYGTRTERSAKSRTNGKLSKAVGAYKDEKLVISFPSANEAGRNGFNCFHIWACCNGKSKTHKGYTWKYL